MKCAECIRLTAEYERLERAHAAALGAFTAGRQNAHLSEYRRLRERAENARLDAEVARLELENHRRRHPQADEPDS